MNLRWPSIRPALPALAAALVIASAAVVWHNLPSPTDVYAPFDVQAPMGMSAEGRAVTTTVAAVRIAPQVNAVHATGVWAVVDATIEATVNTEIPHAELIVGPNTYSPSDRFRSETLGGQLHPGIVERGAWVFDVSPAVIDATDSIALRVWVGVGQLDSRLVIRIGLDDPRVSRTDVVTVSRPEKAGR